MHDAYFHFMRGDLLDVEATAEALADSELAFHLATELYVQAGAENPEAVQAECRRLSISSKR
jgi:GDP-D-mannose dehydratase